MRIKRFLRCSGYLVFAGLLWLSTVQAEHTQEGPTNSVLAVKEYQLFEDIIEPIVVKADSSDRELTLEHRVNRNLLRQDPSCLNKDLFIYLQKEPLVNAGPFASQISVNGHRPEDIQFEIDGILRIYDWGKIQNAFGIFDADIFEVNMNRFGYRANGASGFSLINLSTNPKEKSSAALRFFDFMARTDFSLLNSDVFTLGKVSWLDQIVNRVLGGGFVCPHSREFYSKISFGPQRSRVNANFWLFREGSYIKSSVLTKPEIERAYQTEADWLNEKELEAFWINHGIFVSNNYFIELALSLYHTHRRDDAQGISGMVGTGDTRDLFVDLDFSTKSLSSMVELTYISRQYEVDVGFKTSNIENDLVFHSDGYFYPGFYGLQRGDELSPKELKKGSHRSHVLDTSCWADVKVEVIGLQITAGLASTHRTAYPPGFGPRIQIGFPIQADFLDNPRFILSLGSYRQFPGAERVYVTMYPLSESCGKAEESDLLALGFRSDQFIFSLTGSKMRNLYTPSYRNSRFSSNYSDGYTAGIELGVKHGIGKISSEFGYGYGMSVNNQEGVEYRSGHDPGHNISLSLAYKTNGKLIITGTGKFSEGQRIHRLMARELTPEGYKPVWDPVPNSERLPAKLTMSLGAAYSLSDNFLVSLYVVNFPGYPYAVLYEAWDPQKKSFVKYPFLFGLGTEFNF